MSAKTRGTGHVRRSRSAAAAESAASSQRPRSSSSAGAAGDEEQPPQIQAALGAVLEAVVEVAIDEVVAPEAQRPPHEIEVGAAGVLLEPAAQGELQAPLELRRRLRGVGEDLDDADVGERIDANLGVVELLAERERLRAPGGRLLGVLGDRVQMPEVGVGQRELAAAGQPLEAGDRLLADLARPPWCARESDTGARASAGSRASDSWSSQRPAMREGALLRRDRRVELAGEVALVGPPLQQLGLLPARQDLGVAQRARVLRRGFAMGAQRRGALRRRGREAQHRRPVARLVGVMRDARRVRDALALRRQGRGGARCSATRRWGGSASSTASRASSCRKTTPSALGRRPSPRPGTPRVIELGGGQRLQEPHLGLRGRDRDRLEQPARRAERRATRGEHRVAHGVRDLARARRQHLGDEEGVAAGLAVEVLRVDRVGLGELADGVRRERRDARAA